LKRKVTHTNSFHSFSPGANPSIQKARIAIVFWLDR
jgi:hypothetical protein